jgi:predicted nuclease of restriction endonuclease-like RecB superfamily
MLPSNLLRAKISRGRIRPTYASLDLDTRALAERITGKFTDGTGKKKGELLKKLKEVENEGYDFKLVRGLSTLLERRCNFQVESALNPRETRTAVFLEASSGRTSSLAERNRVIETISNQLGISPEALEKTLFSDLEDELILKDFKPLDPELLIKYYNLCLTQTLLFKSLRVEFSASGNWKNIFRQVKRLGLIYTVEKENDGAGYKVTLDGPLSLFKMTERYGTSIAKLLPQIITSTSWSIKAEILARSRGRVYSFEPDSEELKDLITNVKKEVAAHEEQTQAKLYDSTVEERFAKLFLLYNSGWVLKREPEPLIAGTHVLIPDFSFEKYGAKVYLEIVGFWTPEYLKRKINKLSSIANVDMIIAADESLACSKLERLKTKALVIYYKKDVPMKPIIEHLKERETPILTEQAEMLKGEGIALSGDIVNLNKIARARNVSVESVRIALQDYKPEGYARVGDLFVSRAKLDEIDQKLAGVEKLTDALRIMEASELKEEADRVLEALGYTSIWEGMEMDKVKISKSVTTTTSPNAIII